MPEMQPLKPCGRCEQELPESFFETPDTMFCKRCMAEITTLLKQKYSVIEAAHFRAQLRHSSRSTKQSRSAPVAVGD